MATGIPNVIEDAIGTVHNAISQIIGTTPQVQATPAGSIRVISLSQATQVGLTPAQLVALGYVIVGN
jgi:hypothetical protein